VQTSRLNGKMVAREGAAPPISGCRPDVILLGFPSLARWVPEAVTSASRIAITTERKGIGCRGWIRTNMAAFKGRCPTH
jgi:hypothetical protein